MTIVLGVHDGHLSTAALVVDGRLVACASEERFTRRKNQSGFPANAINYVLRHARVRPDEIDLAVLAGFDLAPISSLGESKGGSLWSIYKAISPLRGAWSRGEYHFPSLQQVGNLAYKIYSKPGFYFTRRQRLRLIQDHLVIAPTKIRVLEHHYCHAFSAMFGAPWKRETFLVMTLDGEGDEICATVNIAENGMLRRLASTQKKASLGWIYAEVTRYLGMKPLEHEYKVMGLAPYAPPDGVEKTYQIMKRMISLSAQNPFLFESPMRTNAANIFLEHKLRGHRFDWIAGATQRLTEELIVKWVSYAVRETGIHNVALAGGVFMNVKANLSVLKLEEVEKLFVFPSCGDESNPIGAAWWGYSQLTHDDSLLPLHDLYLGPSFEDHEIEEALPQKKFQFQKHKKIEKIISELIADGKVVARVSGRMEWGARALGNRSILAHPGDWETVRVINSLIKQRDFWMPFAPSILKEYAENYVENPKEMSAPYMIMAFDIKKSAKMHLRAAMHPYDFTIRPQLVDRDWNSSYYDIIERFRSITGIGGVLNTSFNLHGEPIVNSPKDAIHVLSDSGLEYLAIGSYLVSKGEGA